jgi:cobalt-zinc-cadmium efflux system membrane fusion protein
MKLRPPLALFLTLALGAGAVWLTWRYAGSVTVASHDHDHDHGHGEHDDHAAEPAKGPHGGRLLRDGAFVVELQIFERGVPSEYRAYVTFGGQRVALNEIELTVTLQRFAGREDVIRFQPEGEYLLGDREVSAPHSFVVNIVARHQGREHKWSFDSFEGRVQMSAAAAARAGGVVSEAGPATLRETLAVPARVVLNEDAITRVTPRYAGLVKAAGKMIGDTVDAGELLAVIEANESLQSFEVRAPRAGTVLARHVTAGGAAVVGEALYTLADLSSVWVDLLVPRADAARVRPGQTVTLAAPGLPDTKAVIATLPPFGDVESQSSVARVVLPNPDGAWRPGLFAQGEIQLGEHAASVVVPAAALQTFRDWTVVFRNEGELYEVLPVTTGRHAGELVEITAGLEPGMRYVTGNSFLIKADILKSGASHDH